jgi:hypothetical protein
VFGRYVSKTMLRSSARVAGGIALLTAMILPVVGGEYYRENMVRNKASAFAGHPL